MSATFETKYAEVTVDVDDANPKEDYFGYIAVRFNPDGGKYGFFMDTYDIAIQDDLRQMFRTIPNYNIEKQIYIEDGTVMLNLTRIADKIYAPDVVKIVKKYENEYDSKVG